MFNFGQGMGSDLKPILTNLYRIQKKIWSSLMKSGRNTISNQINLTNEMNPSRGVADVDAGLQRVLLEDLAQLVDGLVDEEERHEGVEDVLRELGEVLDERRALEERLANTSQWTQMDSSH